MSHGRAVLLPLALCLFIVSPLFAITRTWTGGGTTNKWSDTANWSGGIAPVAGDELVFPSGATRLSSTNDLAAALMFQSIRLSGSGYVIDGNTIGVMAGVSQTVSGFTLNAALKLGATQTFNLNDAAINGAIDLNGFDLTMEGVVASFNGVIGGSGNITTFGNEIRLTGNNTYSGKTTIKAVGAISGFQPQSDVTVGSVTFGGRFYGIGGSVGNLTLDVNGSLAPGTLSPANTPMNGTGILNTKNLMFNSGSLFSNIDINGAAPGSGYDQVKVAGTVTIGTNVMLNLNLSNSFTPSAGQVFTLIDNDGSDPISGTFSTQVGAASVTLNEGAIVTLNVYPFRISYAGGDGNDVTVTSAFGPKTWTGAVSNLWSDSGNWSGGVVPVAGDKLVFPSGATRVSSTNDLAAGLMLQSITLSGSGYVIDGNTIGVTAGISQTVAGFTLNAALRLGATQTFSLNDAAVNGAIDLNGFDLTMEGVLTSFNGVIGGSGNITMFGVEIRLTGNNTYSGKTTIKAVGAISGFQPQSDVTVGSVTFGGRFYGIGGSVGNLTLDVNGSLAPGTVSPANTPTNGTGILNTKNLVFNSGSSFSNIDINGAAPGSGYDQVKVAGTVTIGTNVMLNLNLSNSFTPSAGQVFTLIGNDGSDPVSGTFSTQVGAASVTLNEGAIVTLNGVYPFRISYAGGDGNDVTLNSLIKTTAALAQSTETTTFGAPITLTATVTAQSGPPTGSVTFASDGVTIGTAPAQNGVATLSMTALNAGVHTVIATFLGTGAFADSVSGSVAHVVIRGTTNSTIVADHPVISYGQAVRFTVIPAVQSPASGQATGSVTVFADAAPLGTVPLVSGKATLETTALHAGVKSITATYGGDANFEGSTASAIQQNIAKARTEVDARVRPVLVGETPFITIFVNVVPGSSIVPTGVVSISEGGIGVGLQLLSSGAANVSLSPLPFGDHTFVVSYSGDTDFEESSETIRQSVGAPALSIHGTRILEGNLGVTTVSLVVSLSAPVSQPVRVSFSTIAGSATEGEDYERASGVIEFAPGELTRAIEIHVIADNFPESDEAFSVLLSNPANATIDTPSAVIVIANDDQLPRRRPARH